MKWLWVAISLTCLLLSCDSEKDRYAGLGDLVAERQEVRKNIAEENTRTKKLTYPQEGENAPVDLNASREDKAVSSVIIYEKEIEMFLVNGQPRFPLKEGVLQQPMKLKVIYKE